MEPWHGVLVATAVPWRDGKLDLAAYEDHVRWLTENGCDGVVPNGSLGEYQVLTPAEREAVMRAAIQAGARSVVPGVAAIPRWRNYPVRVPEGSTRVRRDPRRPEADKPHRRPGTPGAPRRLRHRCAPGPSSWRRPRSSASPCWPWPSISGAAAARRRPRRGS